MKHLPSMKQLEYLTSLAETGHFGRAAEVCNVTPSTLSAGIRDLELTLGIPLAERTKRVVLMTDTGLQIADMARNLLRGAEDIMEVAHSHRDPLSGDLKLGVIPTISPFLLPSVLPIVHKAYPKLRLFLKEEQTGALLTKLQRGQIDLALIALPYPSDGTMEQVLFDDEFLFACAADHPLAGHPQIADADLVQENLLLLEEGHCLREHALSACSLGPQSKRMEYEATSLHTLVQMVAAGLGVTLLPKLAVDAGITQGTDIIVAPLQSRATRKIGLVWRSASARGKEFELLSKMFDPALT